MRHFLKALILTAVSLYITYSLIPAINFGNNPKNVLILFGGLFLISQVINPIFSLVLLPINHLTFGLVMFILNVTLIFALINFLPGFSISSYSFSGAIIEGLVIPATDFNRIGTIILMAFVITSIQKILHIIFE